MSFRLHELWNTCRLRGGVSIVPIGQHRRSEFGVDNSTAWRSEKSGATANDGVACRLQRTSVSPIYQ